MLRCPAGANLWLSEVRQENAFTQRAVYVASQTNCPHCELRGQCLGRGAKGNRACAKQMGLKLLAEDPHYASNTVTAGLLPEGVEVRVLLDTLRERDGVVFAGGQVHMINKLFRIGHLGYFSQEELEQAMDALERQVQAVSTASHT